MASKVVLSSLIVSFGLFLGRLMGFAREASLASSYGVSAKADIAVLALTIPDVLVSLLVAGGLSAALIPEFKSHTQKDANNLFLQASVVVGAFFAAIAILLSWAPNILILLFAPGLSLDVSLEAQAILAEVVWLIPLTVLAGVTTAYLQSNERFIMPAMGTFIFNSCVVLGLIFFVGSSASLEMLVYFILIGGALRWLSQLWIIRADICWAGSFSRLLLGQGLLHRYGQAVIAVGLLSLFPVVARAFASFSGEGGVATVNYAWRLVEFPLGLVITVLAVVLFPKLSDMYAKQDEVGFSNSLHEGVTWSLLLAMAIMGPVLASPETFVMMVYGWGNSISPEKIAEISQLLQIAIIVLPFQAAIAMSVAAFNARKDTHIPMKVSLVGILVLIPASWWLGKQYDLVGIMVATLAGYVLVSSILLRLLYRTDNSALSLSMITLPFLAGFISYSVAYFIIMIQLPVAINLCGFLLAMSLSIVACGFISPRYRNVIVQKLKGWASK